MKLKLFIVMLIAVSFAVTGLLGGCSGKKKKTADEPRDDSISIRVWGGDNTNDIREGITTDGDYAIGGYDDGANLIWLAVRRNINNNELSVDTLYVLSGVTSGNDQKFGCSDVVHSWVDFTATSSKSNIAELNEFYDEIGIYYSTTSYDETGTAKISITT